MAPLVLRMVCGTRAYINCPGLAVAVLSLYIPSTRQAEQLINTRQSATTNGTRLDNKNYGVGNTSSFQNYSDGQPSAASDSIHLTRLDNDCKNDDIGKNEYEEPEENLFGNVYREQSHEDLSKHVVRPITTKVTGDMLGTSLYHDANRGSILHTDSMHGLPTTSVAVSSNSPLAAGSDHDLESNRMSYPNQKDEEKITACSTTASLSNCTVETSMPVCGMTPMSSNISEGAPGTHAEKACDRCDQKMPGDYDGLYCIDCEEEIDRIMIEDELQAKWHAG